MNNTKIVIDTCCVIRNRDMYIVLYNKNPVKGVIYGGKRPLFVSVRKYMYLKDYKYRNTHCMTEELITHDFCAPYNLSGKEISKDDK